MICISVCMVAVVLVPDNAQTKNIDVSIFTPLNDAQWITGDSQLAAAFEKIYDEYKNNPAINDVLKKYCVDFEKCYWIGIYLDEPYYTKIGNYELSLEILKIGLAKADPENEKICFDFIIGKKLYYKGKIKESVQYLVPGYNLSKKYPGNVPAWKDEEEYTVIMKLIQDNSR
jgi:hypothetical protein